MKGLMTGATALALLTAPALAQESATGAAAPDQQAREMAMQSAEGVGMQNVGDVEGAFVLQGVSPTGTPIMMVVAPTGELLALAAPIGGMKPPAGTDPAAAPQAGGAPASEAPASGAPAEAPPPGEPAQSGFMATQANPASPQMWDPATVETGMQRLELGVGGAAGEVSDPEAAGGSQPSE